MLVRSLGGVPRPSRESDPPALWISVALAIMLASAVFSLSRGGLMALVAAGLVCLVLRAGRSSRPARWGGVLVMTVLALGLVAWLGAGPVRRGWRPSGKAIPSRRGAARSGPTCCPRSATFRWSGPATAPLSRSSRSTARAPPTRGGSSNTLTTTTWRRWSKGGWSACCSVLLPLGSSTGWAGGRCAATGGEATGGLILGALFGFTTLVVHSFVDFGIHVPAIAALGAVVAAHIAALGEKRRAPQGAEVLAPTAPHWRARLVALMAAGTAVGLALLLCGEGWRMARAESLRLEAKSRGGAEGLRLLEAATQIAPEQAELHHEAGQAYLARYAEEETCAGGADEQRRARTRSISGPGWPTTSRPATSAPFRRGCSCGWPPTRPRLRHADPLDTYIARAKHVLPSDPELHYLAGTLELAAGQRERAVKSWQRSLQLSDAYQAAIVEQARGALTDAELIDQVLPDRPQVLFAAAAQLYPHADAPERRPFCERALGLLKQSDRVRSAGDYHLKAVLHATLDEPDEAALAYEAALDRAPQEAGWRCEFAELLRRQGRLRDAWRQLQTLLADQPGHREGLRLFHEVARDMAEKSSPLPGGP